MNKWSEGNCFVIYMKGDESRWGDDVRAAVHSWDSASSLGLSFFMDDFSFLEPPSEILLTINIDVNVVVQVSSDKGVDDDGDEKGYSGGSVVVDFNDHGFWLEENQQEEVKLSNFSMYQEDHWETADCEAVKFAYCYGDTYSSFLLLVVLSGMLSFFRY